MHKPDIEPEVAPDQQGEDVVHGVEPKHRIKLFGKTLPLPQSVLFRRILGGGLIVGGVFSFLPVLGVWMLPLGLIILSRDSRRIRRMRRKSEVGMLRRWREHRMAKKNAKTRQPD